MSERIHCDYCNQPIPAEEPRLTVHAQVRQGATSYEQQITLDFCQVCIETVPGLKTIALTLDRANAQETPREDPDVEQAPALLTPEAVLPATRETSSDRPSFDLNRPVTNLTDLKETFPGTPQHTCCPACRAVTRTP